jgi:hypothetical protein
MSNENGPAAKDQQPSGAVLLDGQYSRLNVMSQSKVEGVLPAPAIALASDIGGDKFPCLDRYEIC